MSLQAWQASYRQMNEKKRWFKGNENNRVLTIEAVTDTQTEGNKQNRLQRQKHKNGRKKSEEQMQ